MQKVFIILSIVIGFISTASGQSTLADKPASDYDSTLYFYKNIILSGSSTTYRGRKSYDFHPKQMRIFRAENGGTAYRSNRIDFSDPNTYLLLITDEILSLTNDKYSRLNFNEDYFSKNCSTLEYEGDAVVVGKCNGTFALYFIDVNWLRKNVSFGKNNKLPKAGYIKCIIPVLDTE